MPRSTPRAGATRAFCALLSTLVFGTPGRALARADFRDEAPQPPPPMTVEGHVDVEDARLSVRCRTARQRSRCVVTLRFTVRARTAAEVRLPAQPGGHVRVDGAELDARGPSALSLAAGESRRVVLRVRRTLWEARSEGLYLVAEAAWTRHALLGEFQHIRRTGALSQVALFEGEGWHLAQSFRVAAPPGRRVTVYADQRVMPTLVEAQLNELPGLLSVELDASRPTPRWFRRGGPLFMLGTTFERQRTLFARAGYEAGLGRHGFLQGLVETDFRETLALVLLLEGALVSPLYILPSLSAGMGLKVETRSNPHVALRFSLGANLGLGVGAQATLDWDPRGRRTTLALAGRLSF